MSEEPKRYDTFQGSLEDGQDIMVEAREGAYVLHADHARDLAVARAEIRSMAIDCQSMMEDRDRALAQVEALTKALNERAAAAADFHESWVDAAEDCKRMEAANAKLVGALEEQLGPKRDLTNAPCHLGITTAEKCGRCSRELRARTALADAGKGGAQ